MNMTQPRRGYWRHKHSPYTIGGGLGAGAAALFGGKKGLVKRALKWGAIGALGTRGANLTSKKVGQTKIGKKPGVKEATFVGTALTPYVGEALGGYGLYKDIKGYRRYKRRRRAYR